MRRCVALDLDGNLIGNYASIKAGAEAHGISKEMLSQALARKWKAHGMRWMYEEDYMNFLKNAKPGDLPWRIRASERKKKTREVSDETKRKMRDTKARNTEYRREVVVKRFLEFTIPHLQWLHSLRDKWLERDVLPLNPTILANYYEDKRDKEVALLASLLISWGDNCYDRVQTYRKIMGKHPWEWFKSRGFSSLNGEVWVFEEKRIFDFYNELWENCFKYGNYSSVEGCVSSIRDVYGISWWEAIEKATKCNGIRPPKEHYAFLVLALSHADVFGHDVWDIDRKDVKFPNTGRLKEFLKIWMPDYHKLGVAFTDFSSLFGMDDVDFYITSLAYDDLCKYRMKECSKYASWYATIYANHTRKMPCMWREKQPEINFSPKE